MKIKILNWDEYNPKRDQKTYTWLRLDNSVATNRKLFGLTPAQRYVWIVILCEASRDNTGNVEINQEHLADLCKVELHDVQKVISHALINKLIQELRPDSQMSLLPRAEVVAVESDRALPPILPQTTPTYERTNVRTNDKNSSSPDSASDLESSRQTFMFSLETKLGDYFSKQTAEAWIRLYETEYVLREYEKSLLWLHANPKKNRKTYRGWVQFFSGWFDRSWDKSLTKGPSNRPKHSPVGRLPDV